MKFLLLASMLGAVVAYPRYMKCGKDYMADNAAGDFAMGPLEEDNGGLNLEMTDAGLVSVSGLNMGDNAGVIVMVSGGEIKADGDNGLAPPLDNTACTTHMQKN